MKIETRKGLWVDRTFTDKFGTEEVTPADTVPSFMTLKKRMNDQEVKDKVGESTIADVVAFLENPPKGTDDGYWNIFYVAGYVVNVYWYSDYRKWRVLASKLDGRSWHAGDRAFGRNLLSDPKHSELSSSDTLDLESAIAMVKEAGYQVSKIL